MCLAGTGGGWGQRVGGGVDTYSPTLREFSKNTRSYPRYIAGISTVHAKVFAKRLFSCSLRAQTSSYNLP